MRILATGDLHLGRRPARLPAEAEDDPRLSTAEAWQELVALAVEQRIDLVALSGDVVDRDNRFFETLGPLERGLGRLAEAGIDTVAVAGNHDFDVLPRLARQIDSPRFRLLGAAGRWERLRLERPGGEALLVDGWSFPGLHYPDDPLAGYDLPAGEGLATIGLLHTEVGVAGSRYAPTTAARLRAQPVAAWLLGHVHAPGRVPGTGPPLLYPGSLQALGFGEPGAHGPWRVELAGRHVERMEPIPLSRVRYEEVEVEASGVEGRADLEGRAATAVRRRLAAADAEGGGHLRWLLVRLILAGRARLGSISAAFAREVLADRPTATEAVAAVVEVTDRTRPPYDLARLAAVDDPAGLLAAALLGLEADGEGGLVRDAVARLAAVHDAATYARLAGLDPPPGEAEARRLLLRAGYRLLEALIDQKAGQEAAP